MPRSKSKPKQEAREEELVGCQSFTPLMVAYVNDPLSLTEKERAFMEEHIFFCVGCETNIKFITELVNAIQDELELDPMFYEKLPIEYVM